MSKSGHIEGWTPHHAPAYESSRSEPAHAEANQPKEARGNSKAHEKSLRESGHKEVSHHAHTPLHHNASDSVPVSIPPVHRDSKGLDVTGTNAPKHDYAQVHAARDWSGHGSKA